MNVVRLEKNTKASTSRGRGRGRGRGRDRADTIIPNNRTLNVLPKYEFRTQRWPLVNLDPTTSSTTTRTPRNPRRGYTTSSSSVRNSAFRRRGLDTGASCQLSTGTITTESDTCNILAITTGRGDARGEVGMAVIDIRYPHMTLCQLSDCHTYANTLSKINAMQPMEIIIPDTMGERSIYPNGLYRAIKEKFGTISITEVLRMHFHDSAGLDRIKTHCAEEFASVELYVKQKYYALAAAAALLKYVEYIQHIVFAPKSMRIDFHGSQNTAMIDIESAESLELVTSQGGPTNFSLLGAINRCSTPIGRRLLRVSILQPPCDLQFIQSRQDCVAEFVSNRSLHSIVERVVKRLYGTSRLLGLAVITSQADSVLAAEKNLNYIILLKSIIDIIPELHSVLAGGQANFFRKVCENLKDPRYEMIKEIILKIVHSEVKSVNGYTSSNMQRCFAIRSGISDMLDVARQAYCELIDDMQKLVNKLAIKYNLPLSLGCNPKLGYHIEMDAPRRGNLSKNDFPSELIEVHQQKSTYFMTTEYLMVLSQHCNEACQELHLMSNVLLNETLTSVREHIGCLLKLSDDVAELDIVCSLAQISAIPDLVKPTFGTKLLLTNSRHPVMDICGVDGTRAPVSNDIFASVFHNFHTITGPNMSGKSVYLKQIILLQIMAQIGCYVPASKAEFRITDRIFCRISGRDDIDNDSSSFVLEIKEIQYVLQSITPTSLVILDELCRSTTVEEGTTIAWGIAEQFIRKSQAFIFNATHFLYLTRLAEIYNNVTNHYFETESQVFSPSTNSTNADTRLIYTHKLKSGVADVWNYGIAVAKSTALPREIVARAQKYATAIANSVKPMQIDTTEKNRNSGNLKYCFAAELAELLEKRQLTVQNVIKIAREMNISNVYFVGTKKEKAKVEEPQETSSSPSSHQFLKPKNYERDLQLKRPPFADNFFFHGEIKKPRTAENSLQNLVQLSNQTRDDNKIVENYQSSTIYMENRNTIDIPKSSPVVSLNSPGHRENQAIYVDRMREIFTSPNSTTMSNADSWKSAIEDLNIRLRNPPSPPTCYSGTSSTVSINTNESIATPVARNMARKKEADIFRIIEGHEFDENSFFHSFMNSTVSIQSSDED